ISISDKTVSTYKRRLLDKFNVKNIVELTRVAGA
ncbi:LuxR C-terminal-related transcriptional regulator, partial [Vibrio parahaemolyticus]|nr:LuxR C-terminal-related transcriptional regulator [Vibrio parahaemolyticus]